MKLKHQLAHMRAAHIYAELSHALRLKVGAIVVRDDRIISIGYNGQPSGWDNSCEHVVDVNLNDPRYQSDNFSKELKTKPTVLHAEMNALMKLARSNESGLDASMFVTHSPCLECAKGIYQAGIKEVYYANEYRDISGIEFLSKCNVKVEKLDV